MMEKNYTSLYDDTPLAALLEALGTDSVDKIVIKIEYNWDDCNVGAVLIEDETDEEYNVRILAYKEKLSEYNKWYKDNKEDIEAELDRRAKLAQEKAEKNILAEKKRLENKLAKINKGL
jgi:bifunctional DNA-binding transcriptional regulator/antitoxin component of YhaV-PrlF toxin-antitoxin module